MKIIVAMAVAITFACSCGNKQTDGNPQPLPADSTKLGGKKIDSLTSKYVHKFEIGDAIYAQKVFDFYKDYDANTLDSAKANLADTVVLNLADGSARDFQRDSLISYLKKERGSFQSSLHITDAFVALKNTADTGTWVSLWVRKVDVANGKRNVSLLNENWKFNEKGKMLFLRQYARKFVDGGGK